LISLPSSLLTEPVVHRGLHDVANGVQENSPSSFKAAVNNGYGIELDLQMSSDGEAVVFHDYTLDRVTDETGPIFTRTAAEIRQIRLKAGNEPILDLPELLELVDGQVPLLIELKDQDGALGQNVGRLEPRVAEVLSNYSGDAVVMSFNPHSIAMMSKIAPNIPRGLTTSDFKVESWPMLPRGRAKELAAIPDFDRVGASFISHDHRVLDMAAVKKLKDRNIPVLCWTIKSQEQENRARRIADNITFEGYIPAKRPNGKDADV